MTTTSRLLAEQVTIGYDRRVISTDLSVQIPDSSFTVIVGPNACGKSTLLRALSRLLAPASGTVMLDGRAISSYRAKEVARVLGLLPQSSLAPDGITVADLVSRGRHPHQSMIRQWSADDEQAVRAAMDQTGVSAFSGRLVDELSGGQRQRVWVAMLLAQQTPLMLLDEPTTFLDIAHQIELAARYATHLIAMKDGEIVAQGEPSQIVTPELVETVFGLRCVVTPDPVTGTPSVAPIGRTRRDGGR
jgi:iron complex transport system ATP-binding protein